MIMWAQRGHKGCTSAGTDMYISNMIRARVRHGIDGGAGCSWHLATVLILEGQSNSRLCQVAKKSVH